MSKTTAVAAFNKGYRILDDGTAIGPSGHRLRTHLDQSGYRRFSIKFRGKRKECGVHRLMAYQKYREEYTANGIVARHLDGNKENNSIGNIAIGTPHDNWMDLPRNVRSRISSRANRKFTDEQIAEWRRLFASGVSAYIIHKQLGVPKSTLSYYLSKVAKKTSWCPED